MNFFYHLFFIALFHIFANPIFCSDEPVYSNKKQIFPNEILLLIASNNNFFDFWNVAITSSSLYEYACKYNMLKSMIMEEKIRRSKNSNFTNVEENNFNFNMQLYILHTLFYKKVFPTGDFQKIGNDYQNISNILCVTQDVKNDNLYYLSLNKDRDKKLNFTNYNALLTNLPGATDEQDDIHINKYIFESCNDLNTYISTLDKEQIKKTIFSLQNVPGVYQVGDVGNYIQYFKDGIWFDSETLVLIAQQTLNPESYDPTFAMDIMSLLSCYPNFNINQQIKTGLHLSTKAYQNDCTDIVQWLIGHGADPYKSDLGKDLIDYVFNANDIEMFKFILQHNMDPDFASNFKEPILFRALDIDKNKNNIFYQLLLEQLHKNLQTDPLAAANTLVHAYKKQDFELVKKLLEGGADIEGKNYNGHQPFITAGATGDVKIIKYLHSNYSNHIHSNSENDTQSNKQITLKKAIKSGNYKLVQLLVENGADIYTTNESGQYIYLNYAINTKKNNPEIIKFLFNTITSDLSNEEHDQLLKNHLINAVKNGAICILEKIFQLDLDQKEKLDLVQKAAENGNVEALQIILDTIPKGVSLNEIVKNITKKYNNVIRHISDSDCKFKNNYESIRQLLKGS